MNVYELRHACDRVINDGWGDRTIVVADDEEGNHYHTLPYLFTMDDLMNQVLLDDGMVDYGFTEMNANQFVVLG